MVEIGVYERRRKVFESRSRRRWEGSVENESLDLFSFEDLLFEDTRFMKGNVRFVFGCNRRFALIGSVVLERAVFLLTNEGCFARYAGCFASSGDVISCPGW